MLSNKPRHNQPRGVEKARVKKQTKSHRSITRSSKRHGATSTFRLFAGKSSMPSVPLNEAFPMSPPPQSPTPHSAPLIQPQQPDVAKPVPAPSKHKLLSSYRQSALGRGLAISTTQTNPILPLSTIALTIDLGSRYEHPEYAGITHFLSHCIFRSTENRTTGTLFKDMSKLGVELISDSNREQFTIIGTTSNERITPIIGTMWDLLTNHAFENSDLLQDVGYYRDQLLPQIHSNNLIQFQEVLHQAAYGNATLGNPRYMSRSESAFVNRCDRQVLQHWAQLFFTSNRIAINAVNVNHSSFMNLLEKHTNLLPNTTIQHFPTPQASYIAKESHITHRSALNLPDNAGLVDQHVGVAFLAPNKTHPDYASTLVINSMLSTGFIYDRRGAHVSSPLTPQRTPNTRNSHHHAHKQQFDLQINSNFHNFQENHPHHDHISPFLQHVDTTYLPYNDSGLLVAQTNLSTPSTQARHDSIAMMQEYLKSHSTELLPAELVENHKSRLLLNMLNYLGSNQVNLAATLSSTLSTRQFDQRAELTRQNKPDNIIPLQSFKWDPLLSHDPIDQVYAAIQQVTRSDIQRVLTTILNSPPTIVSYTAARRHHA